MKNTVARSRSDETNFGIEIREFFPKDGVITYGTGRGSARMQSFLRKDRINGAYYYIIPPLAICRWLFDVNTGQEHDWAIWSEGQTGRIDLGCQVSCLLIQLKLRMMRKKWTREPRILSIMS